MKIASLWVLTISGALASATLVTAQLTPSDPIFLDATNSSERAAFESLLGEAHRTLLSPLFQTNMKSLGSEYPEVYFAYRGNGVPGDAITGKVSDLADIAIGKAPKYRYVRSPVALVGDSLGGDARTGWTGTNQEGSMAIGRRHLARWRSANQAERSCAINTVAHEISHLVANDPNLYITALTDNKANTLTSVAADGRFLTSPLPIGSYLLGSVAQCTWLQEQGYTPAVDLKTCVQMFGTRGFSQNRCTSFAPGTEIKFRTGLPTPHVVTD